MSYLENGVTEKTPKTLMLGAGTVHIGLTKGESGYNFAESLIGATNGGNKITIAPSYKDVEVDDVGVLVEGLTFKIGETAKLEVNLIEVTPANIKMALNASMADSTETGYKELTSKAKIEAGDYVSNLAYVGHNSEGKDIIIIFEKALCKSGIDIDAKSKDNGVLKLTFEAYAPSTGAGNSLPYKIIMPTVVAG